MVDNCYETRVERTHNHLSSGINETVQIFLNGDLSKWIYFFFKSKNSFCKQLSTQHPFCVIRKIAKTSSTMLYL